MVTQEDLAQVHHHHPHWIRTDKLDEEQRRIYEKVKKGDDVMPGELGARIETREYRQRIRWRDVVKEHKGAEYVARLEARRQIKKVEYLVLE